MSHVVGIDLGTTNSLVAYVTDGVPVVIRDESGDAIVPSIVSGLPDGSIVVGRQAEARLAVAPSRTVYSVKRFMGKAAADMRDDASLLPFKIAESSSAASNIVRIAIGDRLLTAPEISALILRELKRRAEMFFAAQDDQDPVVDRAVITVPAYFNDAQRTATRDAGRLAGLDVLRIVNEPTAASLAYGLDKRDAGVIAVYDFGGGTFDISILRVEDGVFQVLATNGDTHLGGDDIDRVFVQHFLDSFEQQGLSIRADGAYRPEVVEEVRRAVIRAKHELSDGEEATLSIEGLGKQVSIRREFFESTIRPLVERTLRPCRQALDDAALKAADIDEVVLVGGSTRIPLVRRLVGDLFGRTPHTELNPDEVVALGAAVQADILDTGNRNLLLLDVTPLSLGIETMGGVTSRIVSRNSTIPASGGEMFTTAVDNQTAVDIHVVQGERELVSDNRSLARFKLRGIPPMPAGLPRVAVRFQIDADGILSVTAMELKTNVEQTIEVKPSYGLTDAEVERMLLESLDNQDADRAVRQLIDAKTEGQSIVMHTEKILQTAAFQEISRGELAPGELKRIEQSLAGLKHVLTSSDREAIQQWTGVLNDATKHLAELMMNRTVQEALSGRNVDDV